MHACNHAFIISFLFFFFFQRKEKEKRVRWVCNVCYIMYVCMYVCIYGMYGCILCMLDGHIYIVFVGIGTNINEGWVDRRG